MGKFDWFATARKIYQREGAIPFFYQYANHLPGALARGAHRAYAAGARALSPRRFAQWQIYSVKQELLAGHSVAHETLESAVQLALHSADTAWARGKDREASALIADTLDVLFHPSRALREGSDFVVSAQPTAELCSSTAVRALTAERERSRPVFPSEPGKLLLAYRGTDHFFADQAEYLKSQGWKIERFDVDQHRDVLEEISSHSLALRAARIARGEKVGLAPVLQAAVDSADVIWVEWGNAFAAYLSQAQLDKPVIIRIHRYEAQTQWPQFIETSGLDAMVFVADWVRQVVNMHRPTLAHALQHVIPLGIDAARFDKPKLPGYEKTLALVGWKTPNKDPDWAIDVLDIVRAVDPEWKLLLVDKEPSYADPWGAALDRRIREHGCAIERLGFRTDVEHVLQRAGYILSTSRLESFHQALLEGVASRAVPVVRDWPEVKHLNGAGDIYPNEWLVNTPQEAADRILAVPTPDAAAREFITTNMGFDTVNTEIMALIRGNF